MSADTIDIDKLRQDLRAGLGRTPDIVRMTTDSFGTRRTELQHVDRDHLRAILDENERLVREVKETREKLVSAHRSMLNPAHITQAACNRIWEFLQKDKPKPDADEQLGEAAVQRLAVDLFRRRYPMRDWCEPGFSHLHEVFREEARAFLNKDTPHD